MAEKLRTNFKIGDILSPEDVNRTNATINANLDSIKATEEAATSAATSASSAAQAAEDASGYLSDLQDAIQELPDGQAVTAEVAQHTVSIEGLEGATTLGQDEHGNDVKPSDVQAAMPTKEFMEVKMDSEGNMLWTMDKDGCTRFYLPVTFEGETHGVKDDRLDGYYTIASKEWSQLVLDAEDNIVFGIKTNGEVVASTMDANLAAATIKAIEKDIKKEYDGVISDLKAEASDPLDKYVSLASGISQADIDNGTSKYEEIAKKSSNPNMTKQACSVLYNLMKLEKDNKFIATWFLNIDYRDEIHKSPNGYDIGSYHYEKYSYQFRTDNGGGSYSPKEPKVHSDPNDPSSPLIDNPTFEFDPLSKDAYYTRDGVDYKVHISDRTPLIYLFDMRAFDRRGYSQAQIAEAKAIYLTLIKKMWTEYKAIPLISWHESNPYAPRERTSQEGASNHGIYFTESGYRYTYDDNGYPLPDEYPYVVSGGGYTIQDEFSSHGYVIKEILEKTEYGVDDGHYPSKNNTICGFAKDDSARQHVYTAPWRWFEDRCQMVGQFIREVYAYINDMTLQEWDALSSTEKRELEIPIIFRLWHECEDSWAWWGSSMCTPDEYKRFFKLTKENILTYSGSNSIMFGYCTDHNFSTPSVPKNTTYDLRYPGDDVVDIVGFDDYDMGKPGYLQTGLSKMKLVSSFAKAHGKPAFIWETGNSAMDADWFNTWVSVFQTAGVNFAALIHWLYAYPPYYNLEDSAFNDRMAEYKQYYNRSNMPCAEDNFDLTTITE